MPTTILSQTLLPGRPMSNSPTLFLQHLSLTYRLLSRSTFPLLLLLLFINPTPSQHLSLNNIRTTITLPPLNPGLPRPSQPSHLSRVPQVLGKLLMQRSTRPLQYHLTSPPHN